MITVTTDMGKITLPKSVIGNIVMDVIDSFEGKVILSDYKGRVNRLAHKLAKKEDAKYIEIDFNEDSMDLRVYVILQFGTSISNITNRIIDEIRTEIKAASGITVETMSVVVTGMLTKNNIAPRHIEVTG